MKQKLSYLPNFLIITAASLWLGVLILAIATTPTRGAVAPSPYEEELFSFAFLAFGSCMGLFFGMRRFAYEERSIKKVNFLLALLITFAVQHLVANLFGFAVYTASGAEQLARVLYFGVQDAYEFAPKWVSHLCLLGEELLLYIPSLLFGSFIGLRKRKKEIASLTGK
ncbi:MAG: hypothetical protein IKL44_01620 [Clostridia bacterium]|nr:hypothetical protein [Clostridia bacterium]